jgi:2'-5' RNA ligase
MKQVINIIIKNKRLEILRKRYNPPFKKIPAHITLVYPFEVSDQEKLIVHIENCLKGINPFEITLQKVRKSGNYLVLDVVKNKTLLLNLYKKLNSELLSGFENKELSLYLPHITLGLFDNIQELMQAINSLRQQNLSYRIEVEKISLLTLDSKDSIISRRDFKLR